MTDLLMGGSLVIVGFILGMVFLSMMNEWKAKAEQRRDRLNKLDDRIYNLESSVRRLEGKQAEP